MSTIVTSHDFSQRPELGALAAIVGDLAPVAERVGVSFFLVGAAARDLLMLFAHRIGGRGTQDVDFCVTVTSWDAFEALRSSLVASGRFEARRGAPLHRLYHQGGRPLDIVPFGGIERLDRTIAWPPDHHTLFDCFGAREADDATICVRLPNDVVLRVASLPALILLKIMAWNDRKLTQPGKDAPDLLLMLRHYLDCGNASRLDTEHSDLYDESPFDYEIAGARLAGRDVRRLLATRDVARVIAVLTPEADPEGRLLLARQSGLEPDRARELIEAHRLGIGDRPLNRREAATRQPA